MNSRLKVVIPVFSSNLSGKMFAIGGMNPGVGGTQFVSIQLALQLAKRFSGIKLQLVSQGAIHVSGAPSNLEFRLVDTASDLFDDLDFGLFKYVFIIPASILCEFKPSVIKLYRDSIISWVHHPFWLDSRLRSVAANVHVGAYQYFTNHLFYKNNWHINNLFSLPAEYGIRQAPDKHSKIRIVFLGALVRAKGFLHVARQWCSIKDTIPNVELHVIGSSQTYGTIADHPLIPCDHEFAREILDFIPANDIDSGKVVFYGNLGEEKFEILRSAHIAILNPTGASEAFPASPLECMACGLPVIASDDYGMSDSMRFFPELVLKSPEDIPSRICFLINHQFSYEEISARSISVAKWFDSQTEVTLTRWRRLIEHVVGGQLYAIKNCPPIDRIHGSSYRLRWRQARILLRLLVRLVLRRM